MIGCREHNTGTDVVMIVVLPLSPGCREPVATMCRRQRAQRGRGLRQLGQLEDWEREGRYTVCCSVLYHNAPLTVLAEA